LDANCCPIDLPQYLDYYQQGRSHCGDRSSGAANIGDVNRTLLRDKTGDAARSALIFD
jgi:hypothetical protein